MPFYIYIISEVGLQSFFLVLFLSVVGIKVRLVP